MDSDPCTNSGSALTAFPCQVCWHTVTYRKKKMIQRTCWSTTGLKGQSIASLLIKRFPPFKGLSSSSWTPSVSLFVKGQTGHPVSVQSFLSPSCFMVWNPKELDPTYSLKVQIWPPSSDCLGLKVNKTLSTDMRTNYIFIPVSLLEWIIQSVKACLIFFLQFTCDLPM